MTTRALLLLPLLLPGCVTWLAQEHLGPGPTARFHQPGRTLVVGDRLEVEARRTLYASGPFGCAAPLEDPLPTTLVYDLTERAPLEPVELRRGALEGGGEGGARLDPALGQFVVTVAGQPVPVSLEAEPSLLHTVAARCLIPVTVALDLVLWPFYAPVLLLR